MPYPAQVDRDQLIETAWQMLESEGVEQLSLSNLAKRFGVKAPSLYRHIDNKAALLRAVNELTDKRLFAAINTQLEQVDNQPIEQAKAVARGYRQFAHEHPRVFMLFSTTSDPEARPDPDEQIQNVLPMQKIMMEISGEADSLAALRGMLALVHGFVMLEINDQLRRGGDLNEAFEKSIDAYLRGWKENGRV